MDAKRDIINANHSSKKRMKIAQNRLKTNRKSAQHCRYMLYIYKDRAIFTLNFFFHGKEFSSPQTQIYWIYVRRGKENEIFVLLSCIEREKNCTNECHQIDFRLTFHLFGKYPFLPSIEMYTKIWNIFQFTKERKICSV